MFLVPCRELNRPPVLLSVFVVPWSLDLRIFETVTLQDEAYGDRSGGSQCISVDRTRGLGTEERKGILFIYYL
jgi:hypothetical protein